MIECPTCKRTHQDQAKVDECKARAERRAEREAAREADRRKREANERRLPATDFIQQQANRGVHFEKIVAALNRDYPVRPQGKWTLWEVVREDTKKLLPTWQMELDRATEMRLQKIFTGEWIGHYPENERDVLDEIPWTDEELKAAAARRRAEAKEAAA